MRRGLFPGQEAALREELERAKRQAARKTNRRTILGAALGLAVGGITGVVATPGARTEERSESVGRIAVPPSAPAWMYETATGDLDVLVRRQGRFLVELNQAEHIDARLWLGATRLMNALAEGDERVDPASRHLILRLRSKHPPPVQEAWLDWVEERGR